MSEKIIVPNLGESINEATVGKWLKEIGDEINEDDPLVELETDKVNIEVPSPSAGILSKVNYKNGETVSVGSQLGIVEKSANKTIKKVDKIEEPKSQENKSEETKRDVSNVIKLEKEPQLFEEKDEKPIILSNELEEANTKTTEEKSEENLSPAVRKIVKEKNIDVMSIEGTGKDGRILKGDIIKLMEL